MEVTHGNQKDCIESESKSENFTREVCKKSSSGNEARTQVMTGLVDAPGFSFPASGEAGMSDSIRDRLLKEAGDSPEPIEIKVTRTEFTDLRSEMLEHGVKWETYRFPMANRIELLEGGKLRVIVLIDYGD